MIKKMKCFSKIDGISPQITLSYKGGLLHSSLFSGLLSLICYILIIICGIYYLRIFFLKENPNLFFYSRDTIDAGNFPVNSSSMFNCLQLIREGEAVDIDLDSLRFIGLEVPIDSYATYNELTNYDHWIYGQCDNNADFRGISNLINSNDYFKSVCIRKYYNKTVGKYYKTSDINFRWPSVNKGTSNKDGTFYGIVIEKCRNDSVRINLEKKYC